MAQELPDRRHELFGRKRDIRKLLARAGKKGITALVARPQMGKTWTLLEVARTLDSEGQYLIGYHESKGSEQSHLLYAAQDLYDRWLEQASYTDQFKKLWDDHRKNLATNLGTAIGNLYGAVSGSVSKGVSKAVEKTFSSLTNAQERLKTGGLVLPTLDYEQAKALTGFVHRVSKQKIILILDAWEKSPSLEQEYGLFEVLLSHLNAWPDLHIFLGIRHPDQFEQKPIKANEFANALDRRSQRFSCVKLLDMDLDGEKERRRMLDHLHHDVSIVGTVPEVQIINWIHGFPGVLDRWKDREKPPQNSGELQKIASDAQQYRYPELKEKFEKAATPELDVLARLALLPRLTDQYWPLFKDLILKVGEEHYIVDFIRDGVLKKEDIPTFGHDARHEAAGSWFAEEYAWRLKELFGEMVARLAEPIKDPVSEYIPNIEILASFKKWIGRLKTDDDSFALVASALSLIHDFDFSMHPRFDHGIQGSNKTRPLLLMIWGLVNRGVHKGEAGDTSGEIEDYTAVTELEGAPVDEVAKALYNRGVCKRAAGDTSGEIEDYTTVIELEGAPVAQVAKALYNRGFCKGAAGDTSGEIEDYTAVIESEGVPVDEVAKALNNRGVCKGEAGDPSGAIEDYTAVTELEGAPVDEVAKALYNRGFCKGAAGDPSGAIEDYTAVIELEGAPVDQVATALYDRGVCKGEAGDPSGAIEDYTAVIELEGAPVEQVATAFYNRACSYSLNQNVDSALPDLEMAFELDKDCSLKDLARTDTDLKILRGMPTFDNLITKRGRIGDR